MLLLHPPTRLTKPNIQKFIFSFTKISSNQNSFLSSSTANTTIISVRQLLQPIVHFSATANLTTNSTAILTTLARLSPPPLLSPQQSSQWTSGSSDHHRTEHFSSSITVHLHSIRRPASPVMMVAIWPKTGEKRDILAAQRENNCSKRLIITISNRLLVSFPPTPSIFLIQSNKKGDVLVALLVEGNQTKWKR